MGHASRFGRPQPRIAQAATVPRRLVAGFLPRPVAGWTLWSNASLSDQRARLPLRAPNSFF
eukprot:scaffold81755_cov55-Phaeocystis_antarctica.AAC.3